MSLSERGKGERDRGGERVGERAGVKFLVVKILFLSGHNSTLTSDPFQRSSYAVVYLSEELQQTP